MRTATVTLAITGCLLAAPTRAQDPTTPRVSVWRDGAWRVANAGTKTWAWCQARTGPARATIGALSVGTVAVLQEGDFSPKRQDTAQLPTVACREKETGPLIDAILVDRSAIPAIAMPAPPQATTQAMPPAATLEPAMRARCSNEWPTDFQMQAFCLTKQREAAATLSGRTMSTPNERTIRTMCQAEWRDDLTMQNFCEEQQLKALRSLGK